MPTLRDIEEFHRISDRLLMTNFCWLWIGATNEDGYGRVYFRKRNWPIHKMIYTIFIGEVPKGMILHHKCQIHSCVNPNHLEPKTQHAHLLGHLREGRLTCRKGHVLTEVGTYRRPHLRGRMKTPELACCECRREALRRNWDRHKDRYNAARHAANLEKQ